MKKTTALSALLVILASQGLLANQIVIAVGGGGYGPWQTGSGGEFTFQTGLSLAGYVPGGITAGVVYQNTFESFCDSPTYIYPNEASSVGAISFQNDRGYTISVGDAWLYSQFAQGLLPYDYLNNGLGRHTSAGLLQDALWQGSADPGLIGEQNLSTTYDPSNPYDTLVGLHFDPSDAATGWADALASVTSSDNYGVHILDLTDVPGGHPAVQSMFYYNSVPDGGMTITLLGGAFLGLRAIRRKLNR